MKRPLGLVTSRIHHVRASLIGALGLLLAVGCAAPTADHSSVDSAELVTDSNAMPEPILAFLETEGWGNHHLEWHTVRQWDRMDADNQAWAKSQHWSRAEIQEGQRGNGLEFLAMHRVMIRMLVDKFPTNAELFDGFAVPPTDCSDADDPCGPPSRDQAFDADKAEAIDKLQNHLADFESDDELGLYIETAARPTPTDPTATSEDKSTGIHNYMHRRFMDPNSKIDLGDPSVNLQNRHFWRLHGWIENRWTEFRRIKKLTEEDPVYEAALKKGEDMFTMKTRGPLGAGAAQSSSPPPDSLRKFFEREDD